MNCLIVLAAFVALAAAADSYDRKDNSYGAYVYHGKYGGKCGNDGLYYRDDDSFVFCSNGNSYVQPCAPGTKNSGYDRYSYGGKYDYRDFCDVNLVDEGYAAKRSAYAYQAPKHDTGYAVESRAYGYDNRDYNRGYGYDNRDYGYDSRDYGYGRRGNSYGRRQGDRRY